MVISQLHHSFSIYQLAYNYKEVFLPLYLFINSFFQNGLQILILFSGLSSVIIIIYFDPKVVPHLISENPFKLTTLSFDCPPPFSKHFLCSDTTKYSRYLYRQIQICTYSYRCIDLFPFLSIVRQIQIQIYTEIDIVKPWVYTNTSKSNQLNREHTQVLLSTSVPPFSNNEKRDSNYPPNIYLFAHSKRPPKPFQYM